MTHAHPVPDVHARDGFVVEHMTSRAVALLCTRERANQIHLRASIDNPADAAQNAIHFSKCSETIDINRLQAGGLRQQFFVRHEFPPPHKVWRNHGTVVQLTQSDSTGGNKNKNRRSVCCSNVRRRAFDLNQTAVRLS